MKIKFISFINGTQGKEWRKNLEKEFLENEEIEKLTENINQVRASKPNPMTTDTASTIYYIRLHTEKSKRQKLWLELLIRKTAELFNTQLNKLSEDEKDPAKTTIVAALPEFFWYDINDNNKHDRDIVYYHKPLYDDNMQILKKNNALTELTANLKNLIIFAGTAMHKETKDNHKDEKIFNSLLIYHSGNCAKTWTKRNVSTIDGFYSQQLFPVWGTDQYGKNVIIGYFPLKLKNKIGSGTEDIPPRIDFNGKTFAFDICLDFDTGKNDKGEKCPLSTQLCRGKKTDINVLIAAGMPVQSNISLRNINSPILLRCDGLSRPYAEIIQNNGVKRGSITNDEIIGSLETGI